MTSVTEALIAENQRMVGEIETIQESMADLMFRIEDIGWSTVEGLTPDDGGFSLSALKSVSRPLADLMEANDLLKRANDLRYAYTYADGINYRGVSEGNKRAAGAMTSKVNIQTFFGQQARYRRLKERATTGNLFILRHRRTNVLTEVPLWQVDGLITDENDPSLVMLVRRKWKGADGKSRRAWFRTDLNDETNIPDDLLGKTPLDRDYVIYHDKYNAQTGWTLGVPDALSSMKWAEAYDEYLTNNSKLVRAYARIAAKVVTGSKKAANDAGMRVAGESGSDTYGSTAIFGQDTNLQHLPATGSQVSFYNGRPLASMVAAGMGVSVLALLSDPGEGGTQAGADALDLPTSVTIKSLQTAEEQLQSRIMRDMNMPEIEVRFPKRQTDPQYRRVTSIESGVTVGLLHREEGREALLNDLDIENPKAGLPKADDFNVGSPGVAAQGVTGAAGTQNGSSNDARDNGEYSQDGKE